MPTKLLSRRARSALLGLSLFLPLISAVPAVADFDTAQPGASAEGDFNGDGFADLAIGAPAEDLDVANSGAVHVIYGSDGGVDLDEEIDNQFITRDLLDAAPGNLVNVAGDFFGAALAVGDFDGDGFGDLAIGAPDSGNALPGGGGTVFVVYGSDSGLDLTPGSATLLKNPQVGVVADDEVGDRFGASLAAGDFDGDGVVDLAVGDPAQDVPTVGGDEAAGAAWILKGTPGRFPDSPTLFPGTDFVLLDGEGFTDDAEVADRFAFSLAAGDVNGDEHADLAVGVPGEDLPGPPAVTDAGAVLLFFGADLLADMATNPEVLIHQDVAGVSGPAEAGDLFGESLVMGDFGRGENADLAVGVPAEDIGDEADAGGVAVFYGDDDEGLDLSHDQFFDQNRSGVNDEAEEGDRFGTALAAGNVGNGERAELFIGVPLEDIDTAPDAGGVEVLYGKKKGLTTSGDEFLTQDTEDVDETPEQGDRFGASLHVADFGKSDEGDVAIGAPGESIPEGARAGAVHVLYGDDDGGVENDDSEVFTQETDGIAGDGASGEDGFGGLDPVFGLGWGTPLDG